MVAGSINFEKRLLSAYFLTIRNFATSNDSKSGISNGECSWVCLYTYPAASPYIVKEHADMDIVAHIGVGFCVARSYFEGQCEGLESWERATGTDSHAFSFLSRTNHTFHRLARGSAAT